MTNRIFQPKPVGSHYLTIHECYMAITDKTASTAALLSILEWLASRACQEIESDEPLPDSIEIKGNCNIPLLTKLMRGLCKESALKAKLKTLVEKKLISIVIEGGKERKITYHRKAVSDALEKWRKGSKSDPSKSDPSKSDDSNGVEGSKSDDSEGSKSDPNYSYLTSLKKETNLTHANPSHSLSPNADQNQARAIAQANSESPATGKEAPKPLTGHPQNQQASGETEKPKVRSPQAKPEPQPVGQGQDQEGKSAAPAAPPPLVPQYEDRKAQQMSQDHKLRRDPWLIAEYRPGSSSPNQFRFDRGFLEWLWRTHVSRQDAYQNRTSTSARVYALKAYWFDNKGDRQWHETERHVQLQAFWEEYQKYLAGKAESERLLAQTQSSKTVEQDQDVLLKPVEGACPPTPEFNKMLEGLLAAKAARNSGKGVA